MKNLHNSVLRLVGILSSCNNKIMKAHDVFYFIKLKTAVISPCKEIWQSSTLNSAPWILNSGFFVSGTLIPDSNYKCDPEYLTFIPESKRKISQILDSLTWGDIDPKINKFSVKSKRVNWASNYCVRGTRTQPLICVGCSVHYWVPCAINKGSFFHIAFVVVVDTHLPRFEALAYVLPHSDELTHVVIRATSSVCWGLLFCLREAFVF